MIQFYLAVACMAILLLVDNIIGFILSICVLTLYFRIYTSELKNKDVANAATTEKVESKHKGCSDGKCEMNMAHLEEKRTIATVAAIATVATGGSSGSSGSVPYITEENLLAAQSNIVNPDEYNMEQHSDNVYGSQGLDTKHLHVRGYDTTNSYLGSLSFEII